MFTEDPTLFIDQDEFAVPVVANGISGSGIFDAPGEYVSDNGAVISAEYQVRCLASLFGSLSWGQSVTVNGVSYQVRDNRPLFDGVFCLLLLTKVDQALSYLITNTGGYLLTQDGRQLVVSG